MTLNASQGHRNHCYLIDYRLRLLPSGSYFVVTAFLSCFVSKKLQLSQLVYMTVYDLEKFFTFNTTVKIQAV